MEDKQATATLYNVSPQQLEPLVPLRKRAACECQSMEHFKPLPTFEEDGNFNVLIIDSFDNNKDWVSRFESKMQTIESPTGKTLRIHPYQGGWSDILCVAYSRPHPSPIGQAQAVCELRGLGAERAWARSGKPSPSQPCCYVVSFRVDFVLIRNSVKGLTPDRDFTRMLLALQFARVPAVNSLHSVYNFLARPWVFSELTAIRQRLGADRFPLISETFCPDFGHLIDIRDHHPLPVVAKAGHAHRGMGKIRCFQTTDVTDAAGYVGLANTYVSLEPLKVAKCDLRIQKIGNHYRALCDTGKWKKFRTQDTEIPMTERYKLWADECAKLFGGLDILSVDMLLCESGEEVILEVNDTSTGLFTEFDEEDSMRIVDICWQRMNEHMDYLKSIWPKEEEKKEEKKEETKEEKKEEGQ